MSGDSLAVHEIGSFLVISQSEDAADFWWHIPRSKTENLERGDVLYSPCFSFAGWKFFLIFANQVWQSSSSPLLLFLHGCGKGSTSHFVRYWLGAMKLDGGQEEEEIGRGAKDPNIRDCTPHPWLRFSELRRRMGISAPSGILSVIVRLRTGPETDNEMTSLVKCAEPPLSKLFGSHFTTQTDIEDAVILKEHLKKLLLNSNDHDVTLKVKEKQFKAHKSMLRARSSVFEAMFTHQMKENEEDSVTIEDMDPDCFAEFLMYIYTGDVEDLSAANAIGLYYGGDKYDFPVLKRRCVDMLKASLSTSMVCDIITLATIHGEEELLESAMAYFTKHLLQVLETVEWLQFARRNPIQAKEVCLKAIKQRQNSNPK